MPANNKPKECETFFTAETLFVHAHVRDMSLPDDACVLVMAEASGPPAAEGHRTGWVLRWCSRNPDVVAQLAHHTYHWGEAYQAVVDKIFQWFSAPIPEPAFPHAEAFACGQMPPGVFADKLLELDEGLFTTPAQLLLRPYQEAPEQQFQPVSEPKEDDNGPNELQEGPEPAE